MFLKGRWSFKISSTMQTFTSGQLYLSCFRCKSHFLQFSNSSSLTMFHWSSSIQNTTMFTLSNLTKRFRITFSLMSQGVELAPVPVLMHYNLVIITNILNIIFGLARPSWLEYFESRGHTTIDSRHVCKRQRICYSHSESRHEIQTHVSITRKKSKNCSQNHSAKHCN